jgi:hypothetical protein
VSKHIREGLSVARLYNAIMYGNPAWYGKRPAPGCSCSEQGYPHTFGCGYTGSTAAFSPVTSSPAFGSEPMMPPLKRHKYVACFCPGVFAYFLAHCFCILMRASFGQNVFEHRAAS